MAGGPAARDTGVIGLACLGALATVGLLLVEACNTTYLESNPKTSRRTPPISFTRRGSAAAVSADHVGTV